MKPAIIVPAITQFVEEARPLVAAMHEADAAEKRDEQRLNNSREAARARRLELGMYLRTVRAKLPARDDAKNGWTAFLEAVEMSRSSAHLLIEEAGKVSNRTGSMTPEQAVRSGVAYESPPRDDAPPPRDEDAPPEADDEPRIVKPNRDAWCTPRELAALLPEVDLDPCSNPRSHVRARKTYSLENGEDGLVLPWFGIIYVNGPYSNLLPFAEKLENGRQDITGAGFLVNADHSPAWWKLLTKRLPLRLDFDDRLEFEPPPGIEPSKNDRPQTLLMDPAFWRECSQPELLKLGTLWQIRSRA